MAVLKERCPNCGGTIILLPNASVGECDYCGMTYSLSELQKIKDAINEGQQIAKANDCDFDENVSYESALDTSEADEISIDELCKKSEIALESEQWQIANSFSDEILRRNPKFAKAYLYKLLAEHRVFRKEELANLKKPFDDSGNYRLLIRFADVYLKSEIENYSETVKARHQAEAKRKKLLMKVVIFGLVFAIIGVPILKKASYRAGLFSVEVIDKVNVDYDAYTADFVFKFNIINNSFHDANYLEGYITITDVEGTVLATGGAWFSGVIASRNSNYHELSFDLDRSAATTRIWNTDFSDLVIKYRITEIHFDDGTIKEYRGKDVIVNKT